MATEFDTEWFKARKKALKVSDAAIGEAINRDRSIANKIINGKMPMDLEFIEGFAVALQVSRQEILERVGTLDPIQTDDVNESNAEVVRFEGASMQEARGDLPVFGSALGAAREIDGEAIEQTNLNTGEITEYVKRPIILNRVEKAYALYVQGSSMHPALPDGEMVACVETERLAAGDMVVVYLRAPADEEGYRPSARAVLVKELVRRSATYIELRQYLPAKDFRIDKADVIRIDRVLTRKEMLS